jgi:RNA polymerase sigma-70 factor (ECF subfamily)
MEANETSLVRDAVAGSIDAFGELVILHQHSIYGYVLRVLGNPADAWDVAQETFLRAHRSLGQLRSPGAFRTWLYSIAVNQCRNHLKRQTREESRLVRQAPDAPDGEDRLSHIPARGLSPQGVAEAKETATAVSEALAALSDTYREVAVLRFQHGMKVQQIADVLDLSVAAVESRVRRARAELSTQLEDMRSGL